MSDQTCICDLVQEGLFGGNKPDPNQPPQKEPGYIKQGLTWMKKNPVKTSIAAYIIRKKGLDRKAFQMGKKAVDYGVSKIADITSGRNKTFMQKHGKGMAIGGGAVVGAAGAALGTKALLNYLRKKKEAQSKGK